MPFGQAHPPPAQHSAVPSRHRGLGREQPPILLLDEEGFVHIASISHDSGVAPQYIVPAGQPNIPPVAGTIVFVIGTQQYPPADEEDEENEEKPPTVAPPVVVPPVVIPPVVPVAPPVVVVSPAVPPVVVPPTVVGIQGPLFGGSPTMAQKPKLH